MHVGVEPDGSSNSQTASKTRNIMYEQTDAYLRETDQRPSRQRIVAREHDTKPLARGGLKCKKARASASVFPERHRCLIRWKSVLHDEHCLLLCTCVLAVCFCCTSEESNNPTT